MDPFIPNFPQSSLIGVIGAGRCDSELYALAQDVGNRLAQQGYGLICGGLGGVMAAACKGAKQAAGLTVGILPGSDAAAANPWVDVVIPTGLGEARNLIIVRSAIALIAIAGEYGTLSEIAFSLKLQKPLIGLRTWQPIRPGAIAPDFPLAESAEEAVQWVITQVGSGNLSK